MVKHRVNKFENFDKEIPKDFYLDSVPCDNYDPLPTKTPREVLLELQAGAEIRDNKLRKLYFGEQYSDSDSFEAIDRYQAFIDEKINRFQKNNINETEPLKNGTQPVENGTQPVENGTKE